MYDYQLCIVQTGFLYFSGVLNKFQKISCKKSAAQGMFGVISQQHLFTVLSLWYARPASAICHMFVIYRPQNKRITLLECKIKKSS